MSNQKKTGLHARLRSFKHAFQGLRVLFQEEPNARVHLAASVAVVLAGFHFRLSMMEWAVLCLSMGLVFAAEIINTGVENLCDFVSPGQQAQIKKIKDLAAAAVLVSALTAVLVGMFIFIPRILAFLNVQS